MSNIWKFEIVTFDITLDSSYSTSCSIETFPVLNHIFINKLAVPRGESFLLFLVSWDPQPGDVTVTSTELSWVTQQQLTSLKLHISVVCPSCSSTRNWCSLQSQDYLKENQEGFKLQVSCWWLQAGLFEFCFASTANKQFGARSGGKSERNHHFHPLSWVSLAEGWYPPLLQQAEKEAGNPSSWAAPTGWRCSPSTTDLICEMPACFPCQRFPFLALGWAPDHCTLAAGPWHSSGEGRLGGQGLFKVKKQINKKPSDCILESSVPKEELFTEEVCKPWVLQQEIHSGKEAGAQ